MRARLWNARAALLYSLGGWTTLGALLHYNSKHSDAEGDSGGGDSGGGSENESDSQAKQGPRKEVFTRETVLGLKVTTIVTYRETQPPITRLLRHVKSFFVPPDEPPSEN